MTRVRKVRDPNLLLGDHYAIDVAYTDGDDEVQSCIRRYPWLIQMVKSKQFHELCDKDGHTTKMRCYFCCDCMTPPFCEVCYKRKDHENHTTIQTFRCSNQSGVRTETISKYMDISGVHLYKINGKKIVYINQRRDKNDYRLRNNVSHKCKICEWELDAASASLFCSMQCKFESALGSQFDELMKNSEIPEETRKPVNGSQLDELMTNSDISEETEEPEKKKRHRRKGSPHRAPFN